MAEQKRAQRGQSFLARRRPPPRTDLSLPPSGRRRPVNRRAHPPVLFARSPPPPNSRVRKFESVRSIRKRVVLRRRRWREQTTTTMRTTTRTRTEGQIGFRQNGHRAALRVHRARVFRRQSSATANDELLRDKHDRLRVDARRPNGQQVPRSS